MSPVKLKPPLPAKFNQIPAKIIDNSLKKALHKRGKRPL